MNLFFADIATPMSDPGPQRGDISVRSDPVFPEVRAVRAVSKEDEVEYSSRITKEENSDESNGYFFAALDPDNTFMGDDLESEDLATDPRETSNTARKRSKRNVEKGSGGTPSDLTNPNSSPDFLITSSQTESTPTGEQSTASETPVTILSTTSERLTVSRTKTTPNPQPSAASTLADIETPAVSSTMTTTYPQRSSSQTSSASPASDSAGGMTDKSSVKSDQSNNDCKEKNSTFGSHGLLAFAITLAIAVLLLYALLLVILVPRCCGRRRKQATLTGDAMASPAEENVALMEKKHKKVEPMTSATGLNGEFITAVDLDADQNDDGQKAKDDGAEKDDKEGDKEKNDDKEESTEKSPERCVHHKRKTWLDPVIAICLFFHIHVCVTER